MKAARGPAGVNGPPARPAPSFPEVHTVARDKVPLEAFLEQVEAVLADSSEEQLRSALRSLAAAVPPADREAFLDRLCHDRTSAEQARRTGEQDDLLAEVADLTREVQLQGDRIQHWLDDYGDPDDEGDTLGPYARFVEPLAGLFGRAAGEFEAGNFARACAAYDRLFAVLETRDDCDLGVRPHDLPEVDFRLARSRYLRALYETTALEVRPGLLFRQMRRLDALVEGRPAQLVDLTTVLDRPLREEAQSLADWEVFLRLQGGPEADRWLREVVRRRAGTAGLERLARSEGPQRPRAYLDWVAALRAEERPEEVLAAADEALRTLPAGLPLRAAIADHLCAAAAELDDAKALRKGRWEAFAARPVLRRLLDLRDGTPAGHRAHKLRQAEEYLANYLRAGVPAEAPGADREEGDGGRVSVAVLAHAHLLNGNWSAAQDLADSQTSAVGTADDPQEVVVAVLLGVLFGGGPDLPGNLARLWDGALAGSRNPLDPQAGAEAPRLAAVYQELARHTRWEEGEVEGLLAWCVKVAERRAEEIVSNLKRKGYEGVAVLAGACAEVLRSRGQGRAASAVLDGLRTRYPRHSPFQEALRKAVARSRGA
jgi:hypothetical protein